MFEREKLSGTNLNDWFRQLKLVLRVEKKMYVIEQLIPPAPTTNYEAHVLADWNAVYDAHNEVACLMLESIIPKFHRQFEHSLPYDMFQELKSMFEIQDEVERFDLIQTFHSCKQEEVKPVGPYVIKMKGYVEQRERLGYVLPQDLSVGLILNSLTSDFVGSVRNYNMHNMGKKIGELHALLNEYEKGLPKKVATLQVMAIQGGRIQKANKKSLNAKGKGKGKGKGKDKPVYIPKPKNLKPSTKEHPTKDEACHHCKEVGHWKRNYHVYLVELIKKKKQGLRGARKLKQGALYLYVGNGIRAQVEAIGSYDLVLPNGLTAIRILNMVPTKKVDKTPYEFWYGKVHNLSYLKVWECETLLKRDTPNQLQQRYVKCIFIGYLKETTGYFFYFSPENKIVVASEIPMEVEGFEPPQEEVVPIRRSARTHRAPGRLCLNIEVEEYSLGDLNEPTNYKAALLDPKSDKWVNAMNAEMQSMKDNQVWCLVDLPPNFIAAFYDYEIWKIDVKIAFLNGYLDEDIYMVQPEGFVDPNNPRKLNFELITITMHDLRLIVMLLKSRRDLVIRLNRGAIDWKSSKQSTTAMFATEAEYIAASEAAMESVWIGKFISGLGIVPTINEPIKMFCDNSAALLIANERGSEGRQTLP
ncbi:retrotransposon protein, putative, ty1-copia subclass [Tanacetum coccineum]